MHIYSPPLNTDIRVACRELARLARLDGETAKMEFNGMTIAAFPESDPEALARLYVKSPRVVVTPLRFADEHREAYVLPSAIVSIVRIPADDVWPARTRVEWAGNGITVHDTDEAFRENVESWSEWLKSGNATDD